MSLDRTPVLVGVSQFVCRDPDPGDALDPLAMLEQVARGAAEDAGAGEKLLGEIDTLGLVDVAAWRPDNGPRLVAEQLGAHPTREIVTALGGENPLTLVDHAARAISSGDARIALLAGCNNLKTLRRAMQQGVKLDWRIGGTGEPALLGEQTRGTSKLEASYGLRMPTDVYPVFENALRAHRGLDLETHRRRMGALMSRFSEVAAVNPYAWFPTARSAEEITTVSASNRMVAFPYTKYLNAVMETDQAAGVLLMSAAAARAFGIPEAKWVRYCGGAQRIEQPWWISERPSFAACPALEASVLGALASSGVALDDIDRFDFYSCFPVAVEMACELLGLDEADARGLTVTGGLPYAGGPTNNYTLHSLATMVEVLRAAPGSRGLVTGNGWYLTKHSAVVLASSPPESAAPARPEPAAAPNVEPIELLPDAAGPATIETYTILFGREGAPERGIIVGRTEAGRRFLANTPEDPELLASLARTEAVGRAGRVELRDGANCFVPS